MATEQKRMRQLIDTEANLASVNPILLSGEIAFSSDTGGMKVGPGAWNSLEYFYVPSAVGGGFSGQVFMDIGAANQFEVRRDAASRIRWMSGDGSLNGMWMEYTQSAGSGRLRFYDAAGTGFFNIDMTAGGDLQVTGARWDNVVTPAVTSLLTKGRGDALYQGISAPLPSLLLDGTDDLDTITTGVLQTKQLYRVSGVPSNGFTGIGSGDWVEHYEYSATAAVQRGINYDTGAVFTRSKISGVWGAWRDVTSVTGMTDFGGSDLNDAFPQFDKTQEIFSITAFATSNNSIGLANGDFIIAMRFSTGVGRQIAHQWNPAGAQKPMWYRDQVSGVWGAWTEIGGGGGSTDIPMIILTKSSAVNQNVGGANGTEVFWTWDGETIKDAGFTHDVVTNSERITVSEAGWYEISFIGAAQTTGSARTTLQGIHRINGGTTSRAGSLRNYARGASYGNMTTGILYTGQLSASDYIEVGTRVEDTDSAYTINTSGGEISDECHQLVIKKIR